jgi:hypothetical protein
VKPPSATREENVTKLEQLESAVGSLPKEEYSRFRRWFLEHDWAMWDRQIAADSKAGRLDFLVREARKAKAKGRLREL